MCISSAACCQRSSSEDLAFHFHLALLQTGYTEDWQCAIYECDLRGCVSGLSGSVPGVFLALLQHVNEAKISLFPNAVKSSCLTFYWVFS